MDCITEAVVWVSLSTLVPRPIFVGSFKPEDEGDSRLPEDEEDATAGEADLELPGPDGRECKSSDDLEAFSLLAPAEALLSLVPDLTLAFLSLIEFVIFSGERSCCAKFVLFTFRDLDMLCFAASTCNCLG